ncbi:MAG: FGGY-family carbohydrate kinase, partial [Sphaerochaetaceae bacterium]|nr:FGGY-family carbohydrate kinase [Sphaerochaetaceae bacterium]
TTGGPSESSFLNQLKADITGRALSVPKIPDAELVGSMVIGLTALGEYASLAEAAGHLVRMGRTYEPRKEYRQLYDELFARYRETYRCVKDTWREA